jgi:hypothetical protein
MLQRRIAQEIRPLNIVKAYPSKLLDFPFIIEIEVFFAKL